MVGWPGLETIIVPRKWLDVLSTEELGVAIVRRLQAVASGSRLRELLLAFTWILCGFTISTLVPGGGVRGVAQLVTTCCGFTCWMFLGLLILPTVSRLASCAIDRRVVEQGVPALLDRGCCVRCIAREPRKLAEQAWRDDPGVEISRSDLTDVDGLADHLGGGHGWYAGDILWRIRGWMDQLVGGPGLRRGRRHAEDVEFGEALDFWRVVGVERGKSLLLHAEMKLPGTAQLGFCMDPIEDDATTRLTRTSRSARGAARDRRHTAAHPSALLKHLHTEAVVLQRSRTHQS